MAVTYIGLLRGINVGNAKRVAMADLRALVDALGFSDVRTLLNSGNVVFGGPRASSAQVARRIERALARSLGVSARVTVITAPELEKAAAANPLLEVATDPSRLLVAVPVSPKELDRLQPLVERAWAPEALVIGARVAYLWCPDGVLASRVAEAVGRALGDAITTRNWATVTKLLALTADKGRSR